MGQKRAFAPDQSHVPVHVRIGDFLNADAGMVALLGDHQGQEADAHARRHQLDDEIDLAGADRDIRGKAMLLAGIEDNMIECEAAFKKNEGRACDLVQRDAVAGSRFMGRGSRATTGSQRTSCHSKLSSTGRSEAASSTSPASRSSSRRRLPCSTS